MPLTAAVSRDAGQTWSNLRNLEDDGQSFAYTSVTWVGDTAVLSHWTQLSGGYGLKVKVVPVKWFYGE